jgi:hypothetical protein
MRSLAFFNLSIVMLVQWYNDPIDVHAKKALRKDVNERRYG